MSAVEVSLVCGAVFMNLGNGVSSVDHAVG